MSQASTGDGARHNAREPRGKGPRSQDLGMLKAAFPSMTQLLRHGLCFVLQCPKISACGIVLVTVAVGEYQHMLPSISPARLGAGYLVVSVVDG